MRRSTSFDRSRGSRTAEQQSSRAAEQQIRSCSFWAFLRKRGVLVGRVDADVIDRVVRFSHRMQDVAEAVAAGTKRASFRIVEQISACGTSVSANLYEADEAVSRMDFVKCVGICVKELNECRFWLRFAGERGWVEPKRLSPLATEAHELIKMLGSMIARIRRAEAAKKKSQSR